MASFPEDLPPADVDLLYKFIIYFVILYVLTTAISTWMITRKRSYPDASKPSRQTGITEKRTEIRFSNFNDQIANLNIQKVATEGALTKLNELQDSNEISQNAFQRLQNQYATELETLEEEIEKTVRIDIQEVEEGVADEVPEDEIEEIEAELEQQLMELEEDKDFLSRPKKKMDDIFKEKTPPPPTKSQKPTPKAMQPSIPTPPETTKPATAQPPRTKQQPPSPTPSEKKTPPAPTPSPPSSSKAAAPPPPPKSQVKTDRPPIPSDEPLTAAQPVKVKSEEDEGVFAKSTSIAALRMDMLRELARLKKLIPEDQQDQE